MYQKPLFGIVVVTGLSHLVSGCVTAPPVGSAQELGMCQGANSCKGQAECGGNGSSCRGENACKAQGWIVLTHADCSQAGGKFSTETHKHKK